MITYRLLALLLLTNLGWTYSSKASETVPASDLSVSVSENNASCANDPCSGSIELEITGGTAPYSFFWNPLFISNVRNPTNLCVGNYFVTVTDANQCTAVASTNISESLALSALITYTLATCPELCNGTLNASASGGTPPYSFFWSDGGSGAFREDLCNGSYTLILVDAAGCTNIFTPTTVLENDPLNIDVFASSIQAISCAGLCDGATSLVFVGGQGAYQYDWEVDAYDGLSTVTDLCDGLYRLTVSDEAGCTFPFALDIQEPEPLNFFVASETFSTCFGSCNGSVEFFIAGGVSPYTTNFSEDPTMLCPGDYAVTMTDENNCTITEEFSIIENSILSYTLDSLANETESQVNGSIEITVTGGTGSYSFDWFVDAMSVAQAEDLNNLSSGTYTCVITDENNCSITTEEIIVDNIVAVFEQDWKHQIKLFPNPVREVLHIDYVLPKAMEATLEIFDSRGAKVLEQATRTDNIENDQLDLRSLPNGIYTLYIRSGVYFYSFKIIKMAYK